MLLYKLNPEGFPELKGTLMLYLGLNEEVMNENEWRIIMLICIMVICVCLTLGLSDMEKNDNSINHCIYFD